MKKILKLILSIFIIILLVVIGYLAYVFISYQRIEDNLPLDVESKGTPSSSISTETNYRIASNNIGFGAYQDTFSFFMDGGTESWAFSKEDVINNTTGLIENIKSLNPDFIILQEVDVDSTRSYHVDEAALMIDSLSKQYDDFSYTFACNYDSPFLMYPLTQPHGKSKAGLLTISTATITDSIRRSLPIDEGITKVLDLDRCYSKNRIPVDNGKELVIYNVHLSAYNKNPETSEYQLKMLNEDMLAEAESGNYVIAGGDMNKDLLGDSSKYFGVNGVSVNWAVAFPTELLDDEFTLVAPFDESNPVPTCRNADMPYCEEDFVLTLDGFIVSSNVEVVESNVLDLQFKYSDHNPVYMDFILK